MVPNVFLAVGDCWGCLEPLETFSSRYYLSGAVGIGSRDVGIGTHLQKETSCCTFKAQVSVPPLRVSVPPLGYRYSLEYRYSKWLLEFRLEENAKGVSILGLGYRYLGYLYCILGIGTEGPVRTLMFVNTRGRHNCRGVHSTPARETGLVVDQSCGDIRAAAAFRVDAIVGVSTPLHRGRQDLVIHQLGDMRGAVVFRVDAIVGVSTPLRETGLGVNQSCGDMRAAAVFRVDAIVEGRRNCRGVHSTPSRETGLGCGLICFSFPLENKTLVDPLLRVKEAGSCYKLSATPSSRMPDKISIFPPLLRVKDTEVCRRRSAPSCLRMSVLINTLLLHIKDVGLLIII
ncbi:hypothetical protein GQ457_18G009940 [Hibiscus cannabinus]